MVHISSLIRHAQGTSTQILIGNPQIGSRTVPTLNQNDYRTTHRSQLLADIELGNPFNRRNPLIFGIDLESGTLTNFEGLDNMSGQDICGSTSLAMLLRYYHFFSNDHEALQTTGYDKHTLEMDGTRANHPFPQPGIGVYGGDLDSFSPTVGYFLAKHYADESKRSIVAEYRPPIKTGPKGSLDYLKASILNCIPVIVSIRSIWCDVPHGASGVDPATGIPKGQYPSGLQGSGGHYILVVGFQMDKSGELTHIIIHDPDSGLKEVVPIRNWWKRYDSSPRRIIKVNREFDKPKSGFKIRHPGGGAIQRRAENGPDIERPTGRGRKGSWIRWDAKKKKWVSVGSKKPLMRDKRKSGFWHDYTRRRLEKLGNPNRWISYAEVDGGFEGAWLDRRDGRYLRIRMNEYIQVRLADNTTFSDGPFYSPSSNTMKEFEKELLKLGGIDFTTKKPLEHPSPKETLPSCFNGHEYSLHVRCVRYSSWKQENRGRIQICCHIKTGEVSNGLMSRELESKSMDFLPPFPGAGISSSEFDARINFNQIVSDHDLELRYYLSSCDGVINCPSGAIHADDSTWFRIPIR